MNAADLSDASQRGGLGWYRKDFRLPRARRGVRWLVRFESVNYRAAVWLNGRRIGGHEAPMCRSRCWPSARRARASTAWCCG